MSDVELERLKENVQLLLNTLGERANCSGCEAPIWWIVNPKTGKKLPITGAALNHFADCPQAARFRRPKPQK